MSQRVTEGSLVVSLPRATALRFSGGPQYLDIVWDALDGVADMAETAEDQGVNRHVHIEHLPDDKYQSPDSIPLVTVADWPDELSQ